MYKGNKEREALQNNKKLLEAQQSITNTNLTNDNTKIPKLCETSENNGFQNLSFQSD